MIVTIVFLSLSVFWSIVCLNILNHPPKDAYYGFLPPTILTFSSYFPIVFAILFHGWGIFIGLLLIPCVYAARKKSFELYNESEDKEKFNPKDHWKCIVLYGVNWHGALAQSICEKLIIMVRNAKITNTLKEKTRNFFLPNIEQE